MDLNEITFKRRHPLILQLAPMIDIFTLIIVFLLQSTVVADTSIVFPGEIKAPQSKTVGSIETLPEVFLFENRVQIPFLDETKNLSELSQFTDQEIDVYRKKVADYFNQLPEETRKSAVHVNFLAGKDNSYDHVFTAISFLRKIGFEKVEFVAESEPKK